MDEIGTVERIYCFDKAALLRSVLLSIGLPSVVMFGLAQLRPKYREAFPVAAPIVAIVLAYAQWPAIRAAVTGRGAVVITDRGLQNSTGGVTFVAWNESERPESRPTLG